MAALGFDGVSWNEFSWSEGSNVGASQPELAGFGRFRLDQTELDRDLKGFQVMTESPCITFVTYFGINSNDLQHT